MKIWRPALWRAVYVWPLANRHIKWFNAYFTDNAARDKDGARVWFAVLAAVLAGHWMAALAGYMAARYLIRVIVSTRARDRCRKDDDS